MKIQRGKLIVIEGVDGSGKTTQTDLLINRLKSINKKVQTIKYPRHGTPFFGLMVDDYLNNKFGPADKVDPHLASLIYAADRWETKDQLLSWLSVGAWVIPDRYVTSNLGHQLAKINSDAKKDEFINWEVTMEYKTFQLPQPDLVIYLDLPIEKVQELLDKRSTAGKEYSGGKKDGHESNLGYLKKAQAAYKYCLKRFDNWTSVTCVDGSGLLPPEEIHKMIWAKIRETL